MGNGKVFLKRSSNISQGQPSLPASNQIEPGEIAINYAAGYETMAIKNSSNQIVPFSSDNKLETDGKLLPTVDSDDNGKMLMVVNGQWALVTPLMVYTGDGQPDNVLGNNGDIFLQTS